MKSIWFSPITLEEINHRAKNSHIEYMAIEFIELGADFLSAKMPVDTRTMQPMGILHGGATCSLAETVGSAAANFCVDLTQKMCVGLEINVNHIKAVRGGFITATARPIHLGKSTQIWDIRIMNDHGTLIAISRLTMAVLSR